MYRATGVSRGVQRTTWERSLKNWELHISCFEEFLGGENVLGLVPASLPHTLGYACIFYAPTSPPPIFFAGKCRNLGRDSISCCRESGEELSSSAASCWKTPSSKEYPTATAFSSSLRAPCCCMTPLVLRWPDSRESIRRFARIARFSRILVA